MRAKAPWIVTGAALVLTIWMILAPGGDVMAAHPHPEPRLDQDLASTVMPPDRFGNSRVSRAYRIAQTIPHTLDGLHCHCECRENFGHNSLLTCYQTNHSSQCDICISQAELAATMVQQGEDLVAIRAATDEAYRYRYE